MIQIKTQSAKIEEILKPKMRRSLIFSFSLWFLMVYILDGLIEKDDISTSPYYLLFLGLTTISKSFIWLGFIMDSAVCIAEFMVVWLKVQAPPVRYYWLSVARYLISTVTNVYLYHLISEASQIITVQLVVWIFCIILQAKCIIGTLWMNKLLSNEVDGINNPVAYAVGSIGMQAMAGA